MARSHTHWDGGPVCRFPTKKECDEYVKDYLARRKQQFELDEVERVRKAKEDRIARFDAFIASEKARMDAVVRAATPKRTLTLPPLKEKAR